MTLPKDQTNRSGSPHQKNGDYEVFLQEVNYLIPLASCDKNELNHKNCPEDLDIILTNTEHNQWFPIHFPTENLKQWEREPPSELDLTRLLSPIVEERDFITELEIRKTLKRTSYRINAILSKMVPIFEQYRKSSFFPTLVTQIRKKMVHSDPNCTSSSTILKIQNVFLRLKQKRTLSDSENKRKECTDVYIGKKKRKRRSNEIHIDEPFPWISFCVCQLFPRTDSKDRSKKVKKLKRLASVRSIEDHEEGCE
ncbi:hypothetical protein [Candidatus Similichlamydia epinepheli]|uniref:hypothetical protein n=1 Tax=Candidatus Similichlamydia epinepheli TaxID=1903953 RepID=UPI000D36F070|nr:hypothetical protein [Candidatus Similichlamydia epinepheli]